MKTKRTWKQLLEGASPAMLLWLLIQANVVAGQQAKDATSPEKGTQYVGADTCKINGLGRGDC